MITIPEVNDEMTTAVIINDKPKNEGLVGTIITLANGKKILLDLGEWNFTHHKYMLGVYSHLIVLVVGYFASFLFKTPLADKNLTFYGYWEKRKENK